MRLRIWVLDHFDRFALGSSQHGLPAAARMWNDRIGSEAENIAIEGEHRVEIDHCYADVNQPTNHNRFPAGGIISVYGRTTLSGASPRTTRSKFVIRGLIHIGI